MKIKKLWIPTVVIGAVGAGAKLCDTLFNYTGKGFFLDSSACSMIFVISIIAVLVIGFGMLFADRNIELDGTPVRNVPAAFFGFIASVAIVGSGVISVLSIGSTDYPLSSFINFVLGILGGVVMLYESCICFTGQNGMKRLPYLTLALPAWACSRMIELFIEYSKVSLSAMEMFDVISVIFLTLFLFYTAMFFAEINPKKCVGKTVLYGCLFVLCTLITTADIILKMIVPAKQIENVDVFIVAPTLSRILTCTMDIALCGFAVCFIIGMIKSLDITNSEEDNDDEVIGEEEFFGHLATGDKNNEPKEEEEIGEPVKFSGTTLTLEDTLSMDRKEIEEASVKSKKKVEIVPQDEETDLEDAEEIAAEEHTEPVQEQEVLEEDKAIRGEFEPAFDVRDDVTFESDNEDTSAQTVEQEDKAEEEESVPETEQNTVADEVEDVSASEPQEDNTYTENETGVTEESRDENVFADENGDVDYDEVFRLLDEMSGDNNF